MTSSADNKLCLIFDLDGTLINTPVVKELLLQIAVDAGLDYDRALEIYARTRNNETDMTFSLDFYLQNITRSLHDAGIAVDDNEMRRQVESCLKVACRAFAGVVEFLDWCCDMGMNFYLLSLGTTHWQNCKLELAGLSNFFPEHKRLYTTRLVSGKHDLVDLKFGIFSGTKPVFFNDSVVEIRDTLENFPEALVFAVNAREKVQKIRDDFPERCITVEDPAKMGEVFKVWHEENC